MKKLSDDELDALHQLRAKRPVNDIAKAIGVTRQRVYEILRASPGDNVQLEQPTWIRLELLIAPYLKLSAKKNNCPEICKKLNPVDRGVVEMFADLEEPQKEVVRQAVIEQSKFRRNVRPPSKNDRHSETLKNGAA